MDSEAENYLDENFSLNVIYQFRLRSFNDGGVSEWVYADASILGIEETGVELPEKTTLNSAHPNPFNGTTTLQFSLHQDSEVKLAVYDVNGRLVAKVLSGVIHAGNHEISVDMNQSASGSYFALMDTGGKRYIKKLVLIK